MSINHDCANDPVCGMTVDKLASLRAERAGVIFYFCSDECRRKFLVDTAAAEAADTPGYSCE